MPVLELDPHLAQQVDNTRFIRVDSDRLELYIVLDYLGQEECQALVRTGETRLRLSTVTMETGDPDFRTSQTCDIGFLDEPLVPKLQSRIAQTLGVPIEHAEVMQLQRYAPGQQFKGHTDYFEPDSQEFNENCQTEGNRTWTFMIYLNDVIEGGETRFDALGIAFKPRRGMAVIWNNWRAGLPNPDTMHAGLPVIQGVKYIVTQWFREKPCLSGGGGSPY